MDLPVSPKKTGLSWNRIFAIALVLFILFGLATKLVLSLNMGLSSDSVGEGLEAMDIWKHQNYFLSGYYLPSQDTFLFTELLPLQLIPQILTGYSPLALKAVTFIEFALGVAILSYVVYMVSSDYICALVFAALAANLPPEGYQFFSLPTSHGGTMIFLGIILALLLYLGKKDVALRGTIKKQKKGYKIPSAIQWPYIIGLAVLVALSAISDTIILAWLIIPYILAYLLFLKEKSPTMNIAVACMAIVSLLAYVYKTYFVYNWVLMSVLTGRDSRGIFTVNLPLYFNALAVLLNQGLLRALNGLSGFGILEAASLLVFIALIAYAAKNAVAARAKRLFYAVILLSGLVMFAMYLASGYTIDESSARYLTFTVLAIWMFVAVSYQWKDKPYGALILALLVVSAVYGYASLSGSSGQPNAQEYGLISYLKENNLTFGYSTYWNSNIITYLSNEDVTVRATFFYRDDLKPNVWLSCERWYQSTPDRSFILVDNSQIDDNGRGVIKALTSKLNATESLHYGKYDIYPLEGYHIAPFQVKR